MICNSIDIQFSYASDDSGHLILWAKGHYDLEIFKQACVDFLKQWDGRDVLLNDLDAHLTFYRNVKAPADSMFEFVQMESVAGRGAYPVTVIDTLIPI